MRLVMDKNIILNGQDTRDYLIVATDKSTRDSKWSECMVNESMYRAGLMTSSWVHSLEEKSVMSRATGVRQGRNVYVKWQVW